MSSLVTGPRRRPKLSLRPHAYGNEIGLVVDATYRFEVDGSVIEGNRVSYSDIAAAHDRRLRGLYRRLDFARITGRTVTIAYDKGDPSSAYLDRSFDWRAVAPRAGIGLAGAAFGLWLITRSRRRGEPSLL